MLLEPPHTLPEGMQFPALYEYAVARYGHAPIIRVHEILQNKNGMFLEDDVYQFDMALYGEQIVHAEFFDIIYGIIRAALLGETETKVHYFKSFSLYPNVWESSEPMEIRLGRVVLDIKVYVTISSINFD